MNRLLRNLTPFRQHVLLLYIQHRDIWPNDTNDTKAYFAKLSINGTQHNNNTLPLF
jgi:hypothetical protein